VARQIALSVPNRLQAAFVALACLVVAQIIVASCTPEPAPYAARVGIAR
jgi:hypothetical protein